MGRLFGHVDVSSFRIKTTESIVGGSIKEQTKKQTTKNNKNTTKKK